jgi:hypothetical protein
LARALRWDDPRRGREGFDGRAGWEWENGPDPYDIKYDVPDVPWNKLNQIGSRWIWDNGQWAVTSLGLEPLYSSDPKRYVPYMISVGSLLELHHLGGVYLWPMRVAKQRWLDLDAFEEALKKALEIHACKADDEMLGKSFRMAHMVARMRRRIALQSGTR